MKRYASALIVAGWVAVGVMSTAAQDSQLTSTGLFPVYDSSGETNGEDLAAHLTPAIYEAFKDGGRELVLLNPGGGYSLIDDAASLDYARSAGVQAVLMPKFALTERSGPKDNSPRLRVEMRVLDVASGAVLHSFGFVQVVSRKNLEKGFDKGPGFHPYLGIFTKYSNKSRKVAKQELGRNLQTIADTIRTSTLGFNKGSLVYPSAALHQGQSASSCNVDFGIRYVRQRSVSKSYELFVNDRDESNSVNNEGIVALTLKPGLNLFTLKVKDPPYRMPVQKNYTINRWMNCSADERHLAVEIGPAGEALIVGRS